MGIVQEFRSWSRRQGAPVTVGFLVSLAVAALLIWFLQGRPFAFLAFHGFSQPWSILTYPWAYMFGDVVGLICYVFLVMWTLSVGGTIEREIGPVRYCAFLAAVTATPAILMGLVGALSQTAFVVAGPWLTVGAMTVVWGTRSPSSTVNLYGIIPLTARWLAIITVIGTLLAFGFGNPLLGIMAISGYGLAYAFASGRIPGLNYRRSYSNPRQSRMSREKESQYYDDVRRREKEREERERLRKLFENSLKDDK